LIFKQSFWYDSEKRILQEKRFSVRNRSLKMFKSSQTKISVSILLAVFLTAVSCFAQDWEQFKYDSRHSGNVPDRSVQTPLGLVGAVPLTDAILTSPVVSEGRVYVLDASGTAFCIDTKTLEVLWKQTTRGGNANCNNYSSPVIAGNYVHFGTMGGSYYVLDKKTGAVVKEIFCGEPIFSTPVAGNDRVYFTTLGSVVHAIKPDGTPCWQWDFVKEKLGFTGDRWSGEEWAKYKQGRVTWHDAFLCTRDMAMYDTMLVIPAGNDNIWLEDAGDKPQLRGIVVVPSYSGRENPATFGISIAEDGAVYREWHRRDNAGRVEMQKLVGDKVETKIIDSTETGARGYRSLGFTSVSVRDGAVYRCRPEEGFGFCKHIDGKEQYLGGYPSNCPPVLLKENAVYGGLDGSINVVPLDGSGKAWAFKTAFSRPIIAPVAVCDGRIYAGCEDGYLYILGSDGSASLPTKDLELWKIRSPLTGKYADAKYNWFTNYGNWANTNVTDQGLKAPFRINWVRKYEGSIKHFSTHGGGRMYTHTAEGVIFAVEQETGRLLWRTYYPGVHISYTAPLYYDEKILVPQAGFEKCLMRCLDAATGKLIWEAPFKGSPSWNRQLPPIVYKGLAIYQFADGKYTADKTEDTIPWLFNGDNASYPKDHKAMVRAWDINTGEEIWTRNFEEFGSGGDDAGLCLMDDTLYYTCFFGYNAKSRKGFPSEKGITAAITPETGQVQWLTAKTSTYGGCTISAKDGRLYMGGYSSPDGESLLKPNDPAKHYVRCVDAKTGEQIWLSGSVGSAVHVITVGEKFLFATDQFQQTYIIDKDTGELLDVRNKGYRCTRFTLSGDYLLGDNLDVEDLSDYKNKKMISSGPQVDTIECIGTCVSNGRMFYTAHGSGIQLSQMYGDEAQAFTPAWKTQP
jgi:outer membrane protein assembly factor BamB